MEAPLFSSSTTRGSTGGMTQLHRTKAATAGRTRVTTRWIVKSESQVVTEAEIVTPALLVVGHELPLAELGAGLAFEPAATPLIIEPQRRDVDGLGGGIERRFAAVHAQAWTEAPRTAD